MQCKDLTLPYLVYCSLAGFREICAQHFEGVRFQEGHKPRALPTIFGTKGHFLGIRQSNGKWFLATGPGTEVVATISEGYFLVENEKCAKDEVD